MSLLNILLILSLMRETKTGLQQRISQRSFSNNPLSMICSAKCSKISELSWISYRNSSCVTTVIVKINLKIIKEKKVLQEICALLQISSRKIRMVKLYSVCLILEIKCNPRLRFFYRPSHSQQFQFCSLRKSIAPVLRVLQRKRRTLTSSIMRT